MSDSSTLTTEASRRLHVFPVKIDFFSILPLQSAYCKHGLKMYGYPNQFVCCEHLPSNKQNLQYTTKTVKPPFFGLQKKFLQIKLVCKMILSSPCLLSSPRYKVTQANRCAVQHPKHSQWEFLGTKQIMLRIQICWLLLIIYPLATTQAIGVCH